MNCCQCQGVEDLFTEKRVAEKLSRYHKKGPDQTTRLLTDALKKQGVQDATLLDIGGGVGAVQYELLRAGCRSALDVDASNAYLRTARDEAQHQGLAERIRYQYGDFVELAAQIPEADIVTLDRVICCYPDMEALVGLSVRRAGKLYGLVYPRDTWWNKIGLALKRFFYRLQGRSYRNYIHPSRAVEALVNSSGLKQRFYRQTLIWQVVVYSR